MQYYRIYDYSSISSIQNQTEIDRMVLSLLKRSKWTQSRVCEIERGRRDGGGERERGLVQFPKSLV